MSGTVLKSLNGVVRREAAEWQRKLVAGEVSLDAGLDDCSQAVGQLQKGLVEAKLFHRRLAAQVSSLAMDASARYLIMQVCIHLPHGSHSGLSANRTSSCRSSVNSNLLFWRCTVAHPSIFPSTACHQHALYCRALSLSSRTEHDLHVLDIVRTILPAYGVSFKSSHPHQQLNHLLIFKPYRAGARISRDTCEAFWQQQAIPELHVTRKLIIVKTVNCHRCVLLCAGNV